MKWTRDQLTEASVTLVKIKSQLAVIEKKFTDKGRLITLREEIKFKRLYSPLKKQIDVMEREFLLNVAGNGIEEEDNAEPPPTNKKK
tara:strand:- start:205 stop:465 length:261 start_codon:yes stop_codon:yes gene_type:complete